MISWVAVTTMCLAVVTVLISKLIVLRRLTISDCVITTAMVSEIHTENDIR